MKEDTLGKLLKRIAPERLKIDDPFGAKGVIETQRELKKEGYKPVCIGTYDGHVADLYERTLPGEEPEYHLVLHARASTPVPNSKVDVFALRNC